MAQKESFIQKVFYQISLEKNPDLWQDDIDSVDKNCERIKFLSGFTQTQYKVQLEKSSQMFSFGQIVVFDGMDI